MKKVVWKFPLSRDLNVLGIGIHLAPPEGATVLKFDIQDGMPTLWMLVDPEKSQQARTFLIVGTGHQEVLGSWQYIDTFITGPLVWHLFEVPFGPR